MRKDVLTVNSIRKTMTHRNGLPWCSAHDTYEPFQNYGSNLSLRQSAQILTLKIAKILIIEEFLNLCMWSPKERTKLVTTQLVSKKRTKRGKAKKKSPLQHPPCMPVQPKQPRQNKSSMKEFLARVSLVYSVMKTTAPVIKMEAEDMATPSSPAGTMYEQTKYIDINNEFCKILFKWVRHQEGHFNLEWEIKPIG